MPAFPSIGLDNVLSLIGPAFAIALLVYPDSVLTARSLAVRAKNRLDADAEFFGVGAANIGAGLFQGFPVNGSQSRSFVVADAGAKSQVSNLWAALLVLLTLLFLSPLFENLPTAALAGVVIVAGLGLLDPSEFVALWRYRRVEFAMAVFTAVSVLILGMLGRHLDRGRSVAALDRAASGIAGNRGAGSRPWDRYVSRHHRSSVSRHHRSSRR